MSIFCVKSDAALSCGINIAGTTLSTGLRLQYISVFKQIKSRRLQRAFSEANISITFVRRSNSSTSARLRAAGRLTCEFPLILLCQVRFSRLFLLLSLRLVCQFFQGKRASLWLYQISHKKCYPTQILYHQVSRISYNR